jgi:hypothetical protein
VSVCECVEIANMCCRTHTLALCACACSTADEKPGLPLEWESPRRKRCVVGFKPAASGSSSSSSSGTQRHRQEKNNNNSTFALLQTQNESERAIGSTEFGPFSLRTTILMRVLECVRLWAHCFGKGRWQRAMPPPPLHPHEYCRTKYPRTSHKN